MNISFSPTLLKTYPDQLFAFGVVRDASLFGPNEESKQILEDIYPEVKRKYKPEDLEIHPHSVAYMKFAEKMGVVRFGFPHLQIKRVLEEKKIGNINNAVNSYMTFELMYNLSFSAYDLDKIHGDVVVDVAKGTEEMTLIGGGKKNVLKHDLVMKDSVGCFYTFGSGYADRTKLTSNSTNVLFVIDAPEGIEQDIVEKNMKDLCALFNSEQYYLLDKNQKIITF